jgi:hypothetical protein
VGSNYSHHDVNIDDLKYYCFWCTGIQRQTMTYIVFDLKFHLFENHRMAMVKVPVGKGGGMDARLEYAVDQCKRLTSYVRDENSNPEVKAALLFSPPPAVSTSEYPPP